MATTTKINRSSTGTVRQAESRTIPLSRIFVKEGFNPRGEIVEDDELQAMAETMRERGCLQPVLVRETASGGFELIFGHRRYRAAALASLTEIKAEVLAPGGETQAELRELLSDAVIENEMRSDLNPLQRARGYQAMLACGLNVRGVAERLGGTVKRSSREKRIREHLPILALPEDLQTQVGSGTIPLKAVKALAEVCKIHEDLARAAVAAASQVGDFDGHDWREVAEDALEVAVSCMEELPAGMYRSGHGYPLEKFTLSEKGSKDLAALRKALEAPDANPTIFFNGELLEQARALGVVHPVSNWTNLIVGQDVADQLAADAIAAKLKLVRAEQRRQRERERERASATKADSPASEKQTSGDSESPEERQAREKAEAKAERERKNKEREEATSFNEALGLLCFKHLPKIRVDERVLRILASARLGGDLRGIAARGARLSFPGWIEQSTKGRRGNLYLDDGPAEERAASFLRAAESAGDIAGRAITLIALASLVDQEAVAFSRRSFYSLSFYGPFARQAKRDLNAIVRERIKAGQLEKLDEILAERVADDKQDVALEAKQQKARLRLGELKDHGDLTDKQLEQAIADAELVHGEYCIEAHELRGERSRRKARASRARRSAKPQKAAA